jgi:hypothetical protein
MILFKTNAELAVKRQSSKELKQKIDDYKQANEIQLELCNHYAKRVLIIQKLVKARVYY